MAASLQIYVVDSAHIDERNGLLSPQNLKYFYFFNKGQNIHEFRNFLFRSLLKIQFLKFSCHNRLFVHLWLQIKTPPILYELGQRVKLGNSIDLIKVLIDQNFSAQNVCR